MYQTTMLSFEASSQATRRQTTEPRRYSREANLGPVVLETRDGWSSVPLIDLSLGGAKVRLTEPLKEGTKGYLYFLSPHWRPRTVEVVIWRVDLDGIVLRFTGSSTRRPPAAPAALTRAGGRREDSGVVSWVPTAR